MSEDKEEEDDDYDPTYDRVYSGIHLKMDEDTHTKKANQQEKMNVVENPYYGSAEVYRGDDFVVQGEKGEEKAAVCQQTENPYYEAS